MHVLVPTLFWCDGRNKVIWSYILGENTEILDEMKYGNSRKILFIKRWVILNNEGGGESCWFHCTTGRQQQAGGSANRPSNNTVFKSCAPPSSHLHQSGCASLLCLKQLHIVNLKSLFQSNERKKMARVTDCYLQCCAITTADKTLMTNYF